jgi:gluconokinase
MLHTATPSNSDADTNLIILMGVSGSGKTTLAKALAWHYHYKYLDGDDFHSEEARNHMASGKPLTDEMRLPWVIRMRDYFRDAAHTRQHSTLAFSGLKKAHREELRKAGLKTLFLFLHSDKNTIQARVNNRAGHFMSPNLVDSQFNSLEDPTLEADVIGINVQSPFEQVLAEAIAIADKMFGKNEALTK